KNVEELKKEVVESFLDGYDHFRDQAKEKFPNLNFESFEPSLSKDKVGEDKEVVKEGVEQLIKAIKEMIEQYRTEEATS
ncbi:unnamed protein product, partial [Ilex paraguariensis]